MKWKKIATIACVGMLVITQLSGCGSKEDQKAEIEEEMPAFDTADAEESMMIVQVTAIDGNTITADVGELKKTEENAPSGQPGEKPEGEVPSGEPGEKPEGGVPDGEPGEKPEGGVPDGELGEKPEGHIPGAQTTFTATGEAVTFTVTDDTVIVVEFLQGEQVGAIDNITVGSILEITLDNNQQALDVIVRNLLAGGDFGGSDEVTNGTSANTITEDTQLNDETYTSTANDENALRIDGATVTLSGITVEKNGGESSNTEDGDFYGQNAGLLVMNGAEATISNSVINTSAVNGNGVFSYGEGTTVSISDSTIRTTMNNSGGIQTTGGGTMNASNLDVETQGNSAAAIRSDRGGGIVNVQGGTYTTNGSGSPAIYCTADISVSDATLTANASEGIVVEGKNSVKLTNCNLTSSMENTYHGDSSENIHGIMIYQSMSGDADMGEAYFSAEDGSITTTVGDMFYITNTDCEINLRNVLFTLANDTFLRVEGNSSSRGWGTQGANGGNVILTAARQLIEGNILVDSISTMNMTMEDGTTFDGAINPDGEGGEVTVTLDETSTWSLTEDSYVTVFYGDTNNIISNGHHLYVDGELMI